MTESLAEEIRTLQSLVWSERDPDGRGFASLADAYHRADQPRKAFEVLNEGLGRLPDFTPGHVVAARLYVDQGLFAEGELAARRALEIDPDNVRAMASLVIALEALDREEEAAPTREALTALEPEVLAEEGLAAWTEPDIAEVAEADEDRHPEPLDDELVLDVAPTPDSIEMAPTPDSIEMASTPDPIEDETVLSIDALAPDRPVEDDETVLGAGTLVPDEVEDETVLGIGALAPDPVEDPVEDGEVLDIDVLEPEQPIGNETVLDAGTLVTDSVGASAEDHSTEDTVDVASLAPDDDAVLDVASLAPDSAEEDADADLMDIGMLAPDPAEEAPAEEALDIAMLGPDPSGEDADALDVAALAPDPLEDGEPLEVAMLAPDVATLAPEPASHERVLDAAAAAGSGETLGGRGGAPRIYTRTLGELYAKQGFMDRAAEVFRQLLAENPDDAALASRLAELEGGPPFGGPPERDPPAEGPADAAPPPTTSDSRPERDEELEALARDLTQNRDVQPEFDSPFAWADEADDDVVPEDEGPPVGEYFKSLLSWRRERDA